MTSVSASVQTPHGDVMMEWHSSKYECGTAEENSAMTLSCAAGSTINAIAFASFGTPSGSCGSFSEGSCNAKNSVCHHYIVLNANVLIQEQIVRDACVGKQTCTVQATDGVFGDPCYGTAKRLVVQATCSSERTYFYPLHLYSC